MRPANADVVRRTKGKDGKPARQVVQPGLEALRAILQPPAKMVGGGLIMGGLYGWLNMTKTNYKD